MTSETRFLDSLTGVGHSSVAMVTDSCISSLNRAALSLVVSPDCSISCLVVPLIIPKNVLVPVVKPELKLTFVRSCPNS